jgi:hypothetical protein
MSEGYAPVLVQAPREDLSPYTVSEYYRRLGDWMYGEWTGDMTVDIPSVPQTYHDRISIKAKEHFDELLGVQNTFINPTDVHAIFDQVDLPLDEILSAVMTLVEAYPTPAR